MMDVMVTLPKSRGGLEHLYDKAFAFGMEPYWEFRRRPKNLEIGDRLFVICDGALRGSFDVYEILHEEGMWYAYLSDWKPIEPPIPMKGFQGFRYMYWKLDWERILKKRIEGGE